MEKVTFQSEGITLAGHLFLPEPYTSSAKLPAIIIGGSWLTVKEQMAGLYAQKLVDQGNAHPCVRFSILGREQW